VGGDRVNEFEFLMHNADPLLTFVGVAKSKTKNGIENHQGFLKFFTDNACYTITLKNATFNTQEECCNCVRGIVAEIVVIGSFWKWYLAQRDASAQPNDCVEPLEAIA
jgi:hypothetical protein